MKTRCVLRWNSSRSKQKHTHKFMRLWFVECVAAFRLHSTIPTEWCCVHVHVNAVLHHMLYCTVLFIVHILHRHRRHSAYTTHYSLHIIHTHTHTSLYRQNQRRHSPSKPKGKNVHATYERQQTTIININIKLALRRCGDQFKWNCWWARIVNRCYLFR